MVPARVDAANALKHSGQIRELIFIKADVVEYRELPALWRVYNIFDATADYEDARGRAIKALGLSPDRKQVPPAAIERIRSSIPQSYKTDLDITTGRMALSARNYYTALKYFEAALAREPANIQALLGKGDTLVVLGRASEAQEAYAEAAWLANGG